MARRQVDKLAMDSTPQDWREAFLAALSASPNVSAACRAAGVSRTYAYRLRGEESEFCAAWDEAIDGALDDLEGKAFAIASAGDRELIRWLLSRRRPKVYGDKVGIEHSGNVGLSAGQALELLGSLGHDKAEVLKHVKELLGEGEGGTGGTGADRS